jgi:hypothetical protein
MLSIIYIAVNGTANVMEVNALTTCTAYYNSQY